MKACAIVGCASPAKTRGWCNRHYLKWWAHGDPMAGANYAVRGEGTLSKQTGYRLITVDGAQRLEHVVIAERARGKALPPGALVHHVNCKKNDNRPTNLVVCPDEAYHKLLHRRTRAYDACGNASWRWCRFCQSWDDPSKMYVLKASSYHRECRKIHRRY